MTYGIKATDVVGWTYHADTYCAEHGSQLPEIDPEGNERHPIFGSDEWDGYCVLGYGGGALEEIAQIVRNSAPRGRDDGSVMIAYALLLVMPVVFLATLAGAALSVVS